MRKGFSGTLSVKIRAGWDEQTITGPEVARLVVAEGAELISIHGRTRAQQYRGKANRERIRAVVEAVPEIPVLANGDINQPEHVFSMLEETGAAGVMIGRGSMGNPWIFRQTLELANRETPAPLGPEEQWKIIERHIELMRGYFQDEDALVHNLKKYVVAYAKGHHGASNFRDSVNRKSELSELLDLTQDFFVERRVA